MKTMSVAEAAALLNMSVRTVQRYAHAGKFGTVEQHHFMIILDRSRVEKYAALHAKEGK